MILASQISGSKLQRAVSLGDGFWLPMLSTGSRLSAWSTEIKTPKHFSSLFVCVVLKTKREGPGPMHQFGQTYGRQTFYSKIMSLKIAGTEPSVPGNFVNENYR